MSERIERLVAGDRLIALFGIEVEEASADLARVSAVVKEDFLQVHGLAHGAFIFALLDVAFALNVNAKLDAVAVQWSVSQFRSGSLGEAHGRVRLLHGRRLSRRSRGHRRRGRVIAKGQAGCPGRRTGCGTKRC
jgi:acyl-CoA thioesterase